MNSSKISIVFGTYKDPNLIIPSLESIFNSTYQAYHVYIVDDNSPNDKEIIEEGKKIIEKYNDERISYIKNDVNIGVPFVFKKWIELFNTPYFIIFGAGDRLEPNALEKMIKFLEMNPTASFVFGHEYFDDPLHGRREIKKVKLETGTYEPRNFLEFHLVGGKEVYGWSQASAMYRTGLFKYYNVPVKSYHYWDHYFHCTYLLHSKKVGHIDEYLAVRHVDNTLSQWAKKNQFTNKVERLIQSIEFIKQFETNLIQKGYPVNKYRWKIAIKLYKGLFFCKNINEFQLTFRTATVDLFNVFATVIFYTIFYPISRMVKLILGK